MSDDWASGWKPRLWAVGREACLRRLRFRPRRRPLRRHAHRRAFTRWRAAQQFDRERMLKTGGRHQDDVLSPCWGLTVRRRDVMAELWGMGPAEATAHVHHASRMPTRYLGGTTRAQQARRRTGLSGALPRVPAVLASDANEQAAWMAFRATQRRRRLLAIFARMMARFHE